MEQAGASKTTFWGIFIRLISLGKSWKLVFLMIIPLIFLFQMILPFGK